VSDLDRRPQPGHLDAAGSGKVALVLDPRLRHPRARYLKELIFGPARSSCSQRADQRLVSTINGPLDGFGDAYQVPVGATFAVVNWLDRRRAPYSRTSAAAARRRRPRDARWLIARLASACK
jgi:hypothetical protein